jgi:hypothetical protein
VDAANRFRKRVVRTVCVAAASCFLAAVDIASAQSLIRSAPSTTPRKSISPLTILVAEGLIAANAAIAAGSPYGYGGALLMLTPILGVEGCGTPCYMVGTGIGGYNLSLGRRVSPLQIFLRNEVAWHAVLGTDLLFHGLFSAPSPSYAEGGISLDFYGDDILGEAALSVDSNWGNHLLGGRLSWACVHTTCTDIPGRHCNLPSRDHRRKGHLWRGARCDSALNVKGTQDRELGDTAADRTAGGGVPLLQEACVALRPSRSATRIVPNRL